jgi:hypothetical protein
VLDWFAANKDLIALLISLLALVIGLATVLIAVRQARLDTYARMHEALVQHTAAHGRKLLFLAWKDDQFPNTQEEDWDQINHSLALYDTLGTYVRRRLVPRRLVLAAWHKQLLAIEKAAEAFQQHRRSLGISQPWVGLGYLFQKALRYSRKPWRA